MKALVLFSIISIISASSGSVLLPQDDVCLCCGVNIIDQTMDNCTMVVTPLTSEDVKMFKKLCEMDGEQTIVTKDGHYFDRIPYVGVRGWTLEYMRDFYLEICQHNVEKMAETLFWMKKYDFSELPNGYSTGYYLGRRIMQMETDEIISQLGMVEPAMGDRYTGFAAFIMDDYPDISRFPGTNQLLVRRIPISYEVTDPVKLSQSSMDLQEEHIGDFVYHNPSNYPQKFTVEVEFPVDVTYESEEYLVPDTPLEYRGPNETIHMRTSEYLTESLNYTITFNVTVKPRHTVAARAWGVWTRFETIFNATLNTTYIKLGSFADYNVKTNVTGKKINVRFGRFFLTDIHEYRSNEILIVSYTTIAAILFIIAFIMGLLALFFVIRNIRKCCEKNKISREGYTILNNESTVNPSS